MESKITAKTEAILSINERKRFLTRVVTTPLSQIDETSDLCAEYQEEITAQGTRKKIKRFCPLQALNLLNKMDGAYRPQEITIAASDGITQILEGLAKTTRPDDDKM